MKRFAGERNRWGVLLGVALVGLAGATARADEGQGITVSGSGVVQAMPDTVELHATVEGNAELASDAVEKYRAHKKRVGDALNGLNIKGVSVSGSGLSVNSGTPPNAMAALQAGQGNAPKAVDKVAVQERVTVTLADIAGMSPDKVLQTVTRVIDVVKDAGAAVGPGPKSMMEIQMSGTKPAALATFKLGNPDGPRQQAYEAALKNARAKAERLAQLAGVELGGILAIRESAPAKDNNSGNGMAAYFALLGASNTQPEFTSTELQSIPVSVNLTVQFDIVKKK